LFLLQGYEGYEKDALEKSFLKILTLFLGFCLRDRDIAIAMTMYYLLSNRAITVFASPPNRDRMSMRGRHYFIRETIFTSAKIQYPFFIIFLRY
jgi:hypothetical protein